MHAEGQHLPAAHPRSRGENCFFFRVVDDDSGSSPLTRGKRGRWFVRLRGLGLIPAHAGKTAASDRSYTPLGAHPRSRGENLKPLPPAPERAGSSPLTRGKLNDRFSGGNKPGLIPAHAGKTMSMSESTVSSRAHPRSRGENAVMRAYSIYTRGSSPLTRGKPERREVDRAGGRLIPAHAGKTTIRKGSIPCPQAHPRSRGENTS